uniref:Uncharacterized protein n=1 Tax=Candidatus Kentrum sp. UNK TaxID=2126344 RepID=A0A451AQI9_9GAMM|nr:MAG: hypothetical protein BECKUNK1418G_GA0071005_12233 [Candidatus Kentron sp. UNK]VFK70435.1 MAG: hypothetical protein BECKUNK1418H_GA0071006_10293 [Candidatus Kentron sp. UNK]
MGRRVCAFGSAPTNSVTIQGEQREHYEHRQHQQKKDQKTSIQDGPHVRMVLPTVGNSYMGNYRIRYRHRYKLGNRNKDLVSNLFISRSASQMDQVLQNVDFALPIPRSCFVSSRRSFARKFS